MRTKSFLLRKALLFPTKAQKLELEKLFFITRLITNHYNNKFNRSINGYGKPKIMTYAMLGEQLTRDIDALGGAPPGTLGQAAYLPGSILKPCLREIEALQRRANFNFNNPVKFIYPFEEQKLWLYDSAGLDVTRDSLIIPSEPRLQFTIDKNNINGTVKLLRIIKTKDGEYQMQALYESVVTETSESDTHLLNVIQQLQGIEYSDQREKRNSFMRGRLRRNDDVASKGFVFRRAIAFRLAQLQNKETLPEPIVELEDPEIDIFNEE